MYLFEYNADVEWCMRIIKPRMKIITSKRFRLLAYCPVNQRSCSLLSLSDGFDAHSGCFLLSVGC